MSLSIARKLVAAFVALTVLILAGTLSLARWSFEQGFLDYINTIELVRLNTVQSDLALEYTRAGGSWSALSNERFLAILVRSDLDRLPQARTPMPPPPGSIGAQRGPRRGPQLRGPGPQQLPPTALFDANGERVAGAPISDENSIRVTVMVDGQSVGELRSEPRRALSSPLETAFSRRQLRTSWLLGVGSLLLALGLSVLLARHLLAPVTRMVDGVARLSKGDYAHRIGETGGDELGRLSEDVDRLAATLEANQSSRQRLLADVSHELRTPLAILCGEIEALRDGLRPFDAEQLKSLDQEIQRLRFLVDDLYQLSVSDVGGLRYQFTAIDLKDCVTSAVNGVQTRAKELGLTVDVVLNNADATEAITVLADAQRLDQLLHNVLENALSYTDAPGQIRFTLATDRLGAKAIVTIDDTPPGVTANECERLFDPLFRREASRNRRSGGAGLGLAICQNIVLAHSGTITASPSEQGGLQLRITLPLAEATQP